MQSKAGLGKLILVIRGVAEGPRNTALCLLHLAIGWEQTLEVGSVASCKHCCGFHSTAAGAPGQLNPLQLMVSKVESHDTLPDLAIFCTYLLRIFCPLHTFSS